MRALAGVVALVVLGGCAREPRAAPPVVVDLAPAAPDRTGASPGPEPSRSAQCTALVVILNRVVDRLGKTESTDPSGVDDLERLASELDAAARQVGALRITTPALRELAGEYGAMCRAIAVAAHALATAARRHDAAARTAAEKSLDEAVRREDPVVDRINALCQASP